MYKIITVLAFVILCIGCKSPGNDEQAIRTMLEAQVKEWNKGNIDGYMHGYWDNDSLVFIGKSGPTYGYKATLERYKIGYPSTEQMGKLTTTIVSMKKLSDDRQQGQQKTLPC